VASSSARDPIESELPVSQLLIRRMPMESRNDRTKPAPRDAANPPTPPKRFRIEKLEDRIAPKKGGRGTNNCVTQSCY
jgi:hypothetical protein